MTEPSLPEESIFSQALEIRSPAERAAFLDRVCGRNPALRAEVEALLGAHGRAGGLLDLLDKPGVTVEEPIAERPGSIIGPYKLLQQIGEGGMGVVFMAEQTEPVQRKVALKIIKPGMDSRQVIARFEAERQALALMDHPHIAKVFEAGMTKSGRPYFVMELVKGTPITRYCDEHQLTPRERLQLLLPVCQAVQHAHQKEIIHRDLKPSNVLVAEYDDKPVAKIIDFGVAKATGPKLTERTMFTEFGQVLGTLEYMSPEQAKLNALDIDTRSDIYALGVLLYELLTGTTPFEAKRLRQAAFDEVLRIIREEEPPRPSTRLSSTQELPSIAAKRGLEPRKLNGLIRGELDWIAMKCLEKDRNRRYETANGLARDIERYLHDEPVQACPPSAGYRLRKFVRRNKGPVLAAATVLLVLVGGIFGTTWSMLQARAAARAEKEAKETAQQSEAETKAVLDFVENKIFAAARPKDQAGGQAPDVKLADALKAALAFVDKSFTGQPLIEARLRMTMGNSFWYLGDAKTASEQFQAARRLYAEHCGHDHPDTLKSMNNLANSYHVLGRHTDALKLRQETLALYEAKLGPDHPDTLACMSGLATSYAALGRHTDALKLRQETLALYEAKLGHDDPNTLSSMSSLANSYHALGQYADALKLREEVLSLYKAKLGVDHPDTLKVVNNLANSYAALGRNADALKLREETLALRKAKLGADHPDTLRIMNNLANSYAALGRHADALKLREETLALRKATLGPSHSDTLLAMNNLAESYAALGRHADALKLCEETVTLFKAKLGPDHPSTLKSMNNLASSYLAVGDAASAVVILQETLALRQRRLKAEPGNSAEQSCLAWTHGQIGDAERARLDYAAAARAYTRSVEMFESIGQAGALKDPYFRGRLKDYRQWLPLCRKAEQAVEDLDFALQQPAEEVPQLLDMRLRSLLKEAPELPQKLAAAAESAAKMKERAGDNAERLYDAACAYALCAAAAKQAKSAVSGAGASAHPGSEKLAEEALALLKQAVAQGFKNAAHMKQDKDLDALRARVDFQKLLAKLEAAKKD
jgi:serine/threonine protein kinase/tetratricopeptide (TPR) repeat protein